MSCTIQHIPLCLCLVGDTRTVNSFIKILSSQDTADDNMLLLVDANGYLLESTTHLDTLMSTH